MDFDRTRGVLLGFAGLLGIVVAWGTTGRFGGGYAVLSLIFAIPLTFAAKWIKATWWGLLPLWLLLNGWVQSGRLDGALLWAAACVGLWSLVLIAAGRSGRVPLYLVLAAYALPALAVILRGIPGGCLLALLTLPVAWRRKRIQEDWSQLALLNVLFFASGYLIAGIVR